MNARFTLMTKKQMNCRQSGKHQPIRLRQHQNAYALNVKLCTLFFDSQSIVFNHQVLAGTTVNAVYYRKVLQDLLAIIKRKRPQYHQQPFRLLNDNAPCHTAQLVQQYFEKHNIEILPHPAYSPDLAPCDFFLIFKNEKITPWQTIQRRK